MALPHELVVPWEERDRRLPRRGLRAQRVLARADGEPGRRDAPRRHGRAAAAGHRAARRRPRRPDERCRARRARRAASCAGRRCSAGYWRQAGGDRRRSSSTAGSAPATSSTVDEDGFVRDRRPHQGAHHHRRLQRRADRGRGRAAPASRGVADVAVVGLPSDARRGGRRGGRARSRARRSTIEAIRAFARDILTAYKVPRRIVVGRRAAASR